MAYATLAALILATFLPFAAFLLIMIFTRTKPALSARLSVGAIAVSFVCSVLLLTQNWTAPGPVEYSTQFLASSGLNIQFGFLADQLGLLMLTIVATISLLVQIYSLGYMAGDPGFSRYYAFMSLFAWAMLSLSVSRSLLQIYIFWELVGLSSYLLIGFWYEKFSASQAGKKAFVMTRAGDVAFFLGLFVVLLNAGNLGVLELNGPAARGMPHEILTLSALLIFGGIVGKSAQFPLMTWLPDAMEGPTPVSALLHSATMVAAGVFLFARLFPFFSLSPRAMGIFLAIGTISMLLASTMAMVSRDIKRVWAYSTISQLGFMIMALAAGGYFAGVFHLTTHAGFKALLFLCSGVFIHHLETNDIYDLGRLGSRRFKIPTISIVIAAAALSGIPPLSGYFSKESIITALAGLSNPLWLLAGFVGVFLTAYYSFRVMFVMFFPKEIEPEKVHAQEPYDAGYRAMAGPLIVLAAATVLLGFFEAPLKNFLAGIIVIDLQAPEHDWSHIAALVLALCGIALAWFEFGRRGAEQVGFIDKIPPLYHLFAERWYLDHAYRLFVDLVIDRGISWLLWQNDNKVIDGTIDELAGGTVEGGRISAFLQTVMIQYRLLAIFAVLVFLAFYFFFQKI